MKTRFQIRHRIEYTMVKTLLCMSYFAIVFVSVYADDSDAPAANMTGDAGVGTGGDGIERRIPGPPEGKDKEEEEEEEEDLLFKAAGLETDPEIETFFVRTADLIESEKYDIAVQILQKLVDTGGNNLIRNSEGVFVPARKRAEELIATLPPKGLALYRVAADAEVKGLKAMGGDGEELELLKSIRKRYLMSSDGDESTFRLACIYLDRHRPAEALKLFTDIVKLYPDTTVPIGEIMLRKAYAYALLGNFPTAWDCLERASIAGRIASNDERLASVKRIVDRLSKEFGGRNDRKEASDPARFLTQSEGLASIWEFEVAPLTQSSTPKLDLKRLIAYWKDSDTFPADRLLVDGNRAYSKTQSSLNCIDIGTGRVLWKSVRQLPKNHRHTNLRATQANWDRMSRQAAFQNPLSCAISLCGGIVFGLETVQTSSYYRAQSVTNSLVAVDAKSGKLLWRQSPPASRTAQFSGERFVSTPIQSGNTVVTAIEKPDGLYLRALIPKTGKTVWESFLCAYSASRFMPNTNVALTTQGGRIYVGTGQGVVMAVDETDGAIEWAAIYERAETPKIVRGVHGMPNQASGWLDNSIHSTGNSLILLPNDAHAVFCFDPSTGKQRYTLARGSYKYAVGLADGRLIIAGKANLRCHDATTGKTLWKRTIPRSHGRGILAGSALLLPTEDGLLAMAPKTGRTIHRIPCKLDQGMPLGNIALTNEKIVFVAANQVAVAGDLALERTRLNKIVNEKRSPEAYVNRARLFMLTEDYTNAAADFKQFISLEKGALKLEASTKESIANTKDLIAKSRKRKAEDDKALILNDGGKPAARDDFQRETLGDAWTSENVKHDTDDGKMSLFGDQKGVSSAVFNKDFSGDFKLEFDGSFEKGRHGRISVIIQSKDATGTLTKAYLHFGTSRGFSNTLKVGDKVLGRINLKVVLRRGSNHFQVICMGNRIVMIIDKETILDVTSSSIPLSMGPSYRIGLLGTGYMPTIDNFKLTYLDPTEAEEYKRRETESTETINALSAKLKELKSKLTVYEASAKHVRSAMDDAVSCLLLMAEATPKSPHQFLSEAKALASSNEQRETIALAAARIHEKAGSFERAAHSYLAILGNPNADTIHSDKDHAQYGVSFHIYAAHQLSRANFRNRPAVKKAISDYIDAKVTALKTSKDTQEAWRLFRAFSWSSRGEELGELTMELLKANSKQASPALVDAVLSVMARDHRSAVAARATKRLADHMEKWGQVKAARMLWKRLESRYGDHKISTESSTQTGREIAQRALILSAADPLPQPPPPYKLLWKQKKKLYLSGNSVTFTMNGTECVMVFDRTKRSFYGLSLRTGKFMWTYKLPNLPKNGPYARMPVYYRPNGSYTDRYRAPLMNYFSAGSTLIAFDLAGKELWKRELPKKLRFAAGNGSSNSSQIRVKGEGVVVMQNKQVGKILVVDAFTGAPLWSRDMADFSSVELRDGRLLINRHLQGSTGRTQTRHEEVYNLLTGVKHLSSEDQSLAVMKTDIGGIYRNGTSIFLRSYRDDDTIWSIKDRPASRLVHYNQLSAFLLAENGTFTLHDAATGKTLWRAVIPKGGISSNFNLHLSFKSNEIFISAYQSSSHRVISLDATTGKLTGDLLIPRNLMRNNGNSSFYWSPTSGISKRFIALREHIRTKQGNRTVMVSRGRLLDRASGRLVANCVLPNPKDISKNGYGTSVLLLNGVLIVNSYGETLAYTHDPNGKKVTLEDTPLSKKATKSPKNDPDPNEKTIIRNPARIQVVPR